MIMEESESQRHLPVSVDLDLANSSKNIFSLEEFTLNLLENLKSENTENLKSENTENLKSENTENLKSENTLSELNLNIEDGMDISHWERASENNEEFIPTSLLLKQEILSIAEFFGYECFRDDFEFSGDDHEIQDYVSPFMADFILKEEILNSCKRERGDHSVEEVINGYNFAEERFDEEICNGGVCADQNNCIGYFASQEMDADFDDDEEYLRVLPENLIPIMELSTGTVSETNECNPEESAIIQLAELEFEKRILNKNVRCEICHCWYSSKDTLKKHVKYIHRKIRPFKCAECDKAFAVRKDLKRHVDRVHLKLKAIHCSECNTSFTCNTNYKVHIETIHLKLKPYKCMYCSSCFTQKGKLTKHTSSVHFNFKPFKCDLCDARFTTKDKLQTHFTSVHEQIKPFKCSKCFKGFTQKTGLNRHMETVHCSQKPYQCSECTSAFTCQRYLTRHLERIHFQQYYCSKCEDAFRRKSDLKVHVETCHSSDVK